MHKGGSASPLAMSLQGATGARGGAAEGTKIRVISARDMHRKERRVYEQAT